MIQRTIASASTRTTASAARAASWHAPLGAVSVATTQVPVLMGDVRVGSQTKSFVLKCDLCVDRPGGPACAEACPTKGLTLVDEERLAELTAERARATIENEA